MSKSISDRKMLYKIKLIRWLCKGNSWIINTDISNNEIKGKGGNMYMLNSLLKSDSDHKLELEGGNLYADKIQIGTFDE